MKSKIPSLAVKVAAASVAFTVASSLHAALITQVTHDGEWITPSTWSNTAAPTSGNTYITSASAIGGGSTKVLRTPFGSATFGGDSLTVVSSTELITKGNDNSDFTIGSLILNGGQLRMADGNRTHIVSGGLNVLSNSSISNPGGRTLQLNSILSGSANLTLTGNNATGAVIVLNGASSSFSGSFLGTNRAIVDFNQSYNFASLNLLATANQSQLRLDTNLSFQSVTFGATTLAAGTYTGAALKSSYASFITTDSLDGSTLTVVPEPGTTAVIIGAALVGVIFMRRRQTARA
jgi:hypothetical protein